MSTSTHGLRLLSGSHAIRALVELLSSMRFAISLLTVICIASIIGTVLKQNEPLGNYINQFGPFWAEVFTAASLNRVYSAWWFMLILAFLVVSTSCRLGCVQRRNTRAKSEVFWSSRASLTGIESRRRSATNRSNACWWWLESQATRAQSGNEHQCKCQCREWQSFGLDGRR